jgi:hypothetical protein
MLRAGFLPVGGGYGKPPYITTTNLEEERMGSLWANDLLLSTAVCRTRFRDSAEKCRC